MPDAGLTQEQHATTAQRLTQPGLCLHAGLTQKQAAVAATSLSALPSVAVGEVTALVDGEEEGTPVQENDIVTATVRVTLTRGSHALPGALFGRPGYSHFAFL
jgi:hypothetical protein